MALLLFLLKTVGISLSGVMAPGAVTAATIAQGTRNRWAGVLISVGHGVVEMPLIFLIMLGLGTLFQADWFKIAVGILGGGFLIWMGVGMLREVGKRDLQAEKEFLALYSKKMPRSMLRYAIEKFPEQERRMYLRGEIGDEVFSG